MFNLSYLSSENKRSLEKLQERLSKTIKSSDRNELELLIQEIMAKAKPFVQCDLVESDELRSQLLNKINILSGLGKNSESFRMHLREVEFHIQTLQMQDVMAEKKKQELRPRGAEPPNQTDKMSAKKERIKKEAFGSHRWQIGFEDEPEGTN